MLRLPFRSHPSRNILHSPHHSRPFMSRKRCGQPLQPRKCSMFRITLFFTSLFLALSCNPDKPPTGPAEPAGKATANVPMPRGLRIENLTDTSIRLRWNPVTGATDYDPAYKKVGGKYKSIAHVGTATYTDLNGLQPNTEYRWVVKADRGNESSRWASGGIFKTLESGASQSPPTQPDPTPTSSSPFQSDSSFKIELIFLDSFTYKERGYFKDVARSWEKLFNDAPDYTFPRNKSITLPGTSHRVSFKAGEQIDDLRIYVGKLPSDAPQSSWSNAPGGFASVSIYRPGGNIPVVASIFIGMENIRNNAQYAPGYTPREKEAYIENFLYRKNFQHELAHAFGIGQSPAWKKHVVKIDLNTFFYRGPNAIREYLALQPDPDPRGIELMRQSFNENSRNPPAHWSGQHAEKGPIGWTVFLIYYRFLDGRTNMDRVTLGTLEDIGWSVNYEEVYNGFFDDDFFARCLVRNNVYEWLDFRLDCQ